MNIYKLSQTVNDGYDTYDSCVVCAENEEKAKRIHPSNTWKHSGYYDDELKEFWATDIKDKPYLFEGSYGSWINDLKKIKVELIGKAEDGVKEGVIVASFNAG